ncbi:YNFM family putative membrane transporter [Chromohalobacter marismortui]|uniref:YNFM family putative membrane transporter n=1 Tax=Chromohalobacter marismortui TaxID=42055 RepID=A0A4R7NUJ6_9GAMM|nr:MULTISPECIES: MFS transporter [Chromohalobacter]MCI0510619.1 MFS transporter [Chromohalobacter sp.]MCI0591934.1 MFS transporter [Chromohalobacter sp.]TDU24804.1 YNFM family putative membrane transporter [Chromohalobacter marismortui]
MIEPRTRAWWRATLALCLGSFTVFINLYVAQPLLPAIRDSFDISTLAASSAMSVSMLTLALSLLLYGPLSDAIGRAAIMRVTLLLASVCTLVMAFAPNFASLLALRALQGFLLGGLPAVAIAWMGDEFNKPALLLAVGLYISGNTLGGIGGRVIGGTVAEQWGWHSSFVAIAALSLACTWVFWYALPTAQQFRPSALRVGQAARDMRGHLCDPRLIAAYLIGGFNFFIFINQYSYVTFRLSEAPFSLTSQWLGLIFLTYLGGTLGSALSGRIARRLSQPACMMLGIGVLMSGSLLTLMPSLFMIIAGLTINAVGFFLAHSMASSWVGRHAQRARGSASSLYLVFYYLGASLGGFYLEPFWARWQWGGVIAASLLVLLGTFNVAAWLWRRERRMLDTSAAA